MRDDGPVIPEYGHGGDITGARRQRRAFRFAVLTVMALTGGLWLTESYLRYDQPETIYRMSLTLHPDSARALLRNAVMRDAELHEKPNSRYVEALAGIEEEDEILDQFAHAHELNPSSVPLLIKYGCHLFLKGDHKAARERFREAGVHPPHNRLAKYLEAAALAIGDPAESAMEEAFALIARTNDSSAPLEFPAPLWHHSLPESGYWYAQKRRELVDLSCGPLYRFRDLVITRARSAIRAGHVQDWEQRLLQFGRMGASLAGNRMTPPRSLGTSQVFAGLQFQLDALDLRKQMTQNPDSSVVDEEVRLKQALDLVRQFEESRDAKIAVSRSVAESPLIIVEVMGVLLLAGRLLLKSIAFFFFPTDRSFALPIHRLVLRMLLSMHLAALVLLAALMGLSGTTPDVLQVLGGARLLWFALFAAIVFLGIVFPHLQLASPRALAAKASDESQELVLPQIRAAWRGACFSLMYRYTGLVFGLYLMTVSVWWMLFRLLEGVYPLQQVLLADGLSEEELAVVAAVHRLLI
ncbi:MAG: hypothetical protein HYV27_00415 [Candidatus Hydrogenedentes bacterium]|nr:hypothetical protein [Candidatus Hydrogenedentota bacterium]